ncbi:MAG: DUF3043 domain-containing protein [Promicromonosporaceae bacterium]|nr:DUF3043 domain-containing protein [Promicromonosporaceae bacterium]
MILSKKPRPTEDEIAAARAAADAAVEASERPADQSETQSRTKSGPTRKRAHAEAANKRPLVPGDRRAAARTMRDRQKDQRKRAMEGMQRGEEKYLPTRDRGPQRRFVRDFVDARRNLGEWFLPIALMFIVLNFIAMNIGGTLGLILLATLYVVVFAAIVDTAIMWRKLKHALIVKFGEVEKGIAMYAWMRAFQLRRARLPKPIHKEHGHWPK